MTILQLALVFFVISNPVGNSPAIITLVKDYSLRDQQKILFRESMFSMGLAILFLFLGEAFLYCLKIDHYALMMSGGVLLFLVALHMIFTNPDDTKPDPPKRAPFVVPIATPMISGAGLMTMIILYDKEVGNSFIVLLAILLAWTGVTAVLITAPYLQILLGERGLAALQQLMGMLLLMIAIEMIVRGSSLFLSVLAAS